MKQFFLLCLIICLIAGASPFISQARQRATPAVTVSSIIKDVQLGITNNDVNIFARHFGKLVYVDLPGEEGGYFSEHQLFYILQNFFASRQTQQFKFSTIEETESGPYATGSGSFMFKGHREFLQIYVAFSNVGNSTVITQFNVY